jgi:amino acid adenylation domain-containing protein
MPTQIEGFRMSPQQKRLWLIQLEDNSAAYRAQCAVVIDGTFDPASLEDSLLRVVNRHEILRTTFQRAPGMRWPVQVLNDRLLPSWREMDLSALSAQEQGERLRELYREEQRTPFNYEQGPLVRIMLLKLSPERHMLFLSVPAFYAGIWSLKNLVSELSECYSGCLKGELVEEPLQYAEFSEWQNEMLEDELAEKGRAYWSEQDIGAYPPVALPFEIKRAAPSVFEPEVLDLKIEAALIEKMDALAKRYETTTANCLLACWQTLLWRLTGQPDIVVSCVFDGRKFEELNHALGLISKSLPIHSRFTDTLTYADVLRQVDASIREADAWQEYFTWKEEEEMCLNAVDEVCMAASFEYGDWLATHLSEDVSFSLYRLDVLHDRYKLKLSCFRTESSIISELTYDPHLFPEGEVHRLANQFIKLLGQAVEHPDMEIGRLDLLGDAEREQLLHDFNRTQADYPQDKCFHELFEEQVARTPQQTALIFGDQSLTYEQLNARANQLAHHLRGLGVGPEVFVGISVERSIEMVVAMFGVLKAGATYVPLDPEYPRERLAFMLEDIQAPVLLTQERLLERLPEHRAKAICLDRDWEEIARSPASNPARAATPENLAYVIYTSGSTGQPKGVMISHRSLVNYLSWSAREYVVAEAQGAPVHSPFGFDLTVTSLFLPLMTGQRVTLISEEEGVEGLAETLRAGRDFTLVKLTPSHLEVLRQWLPAEELAGRTKAMVLGGEALLGESLGFWRTNAPDTRLINEYGPTETVVGCCTYEMPAGASISGAVPIGRPIANTQLYLFDAYSELTPMGVAGELYIGGAGVARGYLNRPALTAEKFIPHPFSDEPGARLYRTGDLARYLPDGNLEYLGRNDEQVKVRGYRIELGEIESVLSKHEQIREVVVMAREDAPGDKRLIAYLVQAEDASLNNHELREYLESHLPEYMVPQAFVKLDALPLTPNGKVDRRALPAPGSSRPDLERLYVAPRTELEETLAAIWTSVLGLEQVGIYDNFFDIGGDSIRSVRVVALAKERGLEFTVQQLFRDQTIADLIRNNRITDVQSELSNRAEPLSMISEEDRLKLPEDIEDAYPLATMQAGMLYHMELTPDSPAYHNVNSWHLRVPFDYRALQDSVQAVVDRHAALRTSFDLTSYSRPLQLVHQSATLPLEIYDLRHLSRDEQESALYDFRETERKRLFDLLRPSLMRFFVHRRTDETFQFSLTECHAIIDGWSTTSTLAEIAAHYLALLNHEVPPSPPPLSVAYRDFIKLEQQALASDETREFWMKKISDGAPVKLPRWPYNTPTPNGQIVAKLTVPVPPNVLEELGTVARKLAVPLKTVAFAAHLKVMSMISGQTDLLTGISVNGRPEEKDGTLVCGNFLNTVPFRFMMKGGSWAELIRQVFEAEWEMLPHRRYPLGALQRTWGREPLVETNYTYLNFHSVENVLQPGRVEVLGGETIDLSETNFSLQTILMIDTTSQERATWLDLQFDSTFTSAEQREAVAGYYDRVLRAIAADASSRHDAKSFLSPEESQQFLVRWNDTKRDRASLEGIHQLFAAQAERTPEAVAAVFGETQLSYRELNERANRSAHYLRKLGVGPEVLVGVCMSRSAEMLIALLGVLKAGGAYVPLDPSNPRERLSFILEDAAAPVLLTQQHLINELPEHAARTVCLDSDWQEIALESAENPSSVVMPDNLAYIIYTSGSTGRPKGTLITHRGLTNYLTWAVRAYQVEQGEGTLVHSSISFDLTVTALFAPLLVGRKVELLAEDVGIEALHQALKRARNLSMVKLTPTQLELLGRGLTPEDAGGRARAFIIGGENLQSATLRFWQESSPETVLINEYGPTETVVGCSIYQVPDEQRSGGSVPIGRPIANTQLYVLDHFLHPAPVQVPGELYIGGAGVARGYLNRPALTAEKFIPHPFSTEPGARLYRTGDLARYLPDGNMEFLGRIDHQVKILGYRVEIGEIEAVLKEHPSIGETFVMDYMDASCDRRLVAYLVAGAEPAPPVSDLRRFLQEKLPDYMIPSSFMWLDALPLSASGKVERRLLPAPEHSRQRAGEAYVAPHNEIEQTIAIVWQEVLQVAQVGIHDNFFDLGGDSIRVYEVHNKLRERLSVQLSILDLFRYPTVEALAHHASEDQGAETSMRQTQDRAAKRAEAAQRRKQHTKGKTANV